VIVAPLDSNNGSGGPYRKPRADLYTVLLTLALIAILLGILCLYLEMKMYDFKLNGAPVAAAPEVPIATDAVAWGGWGIAQRCPSFDLATLRPPIT
jgi:hypothetical protein